MTSAIHPSSQPQPIVVNNITLDEEAGYSTIAPIIMKNLQNRSNQSMIVRRGETSNDNSSSVSLKAETAPGKFETTEVVDQQYIIYL